MGSATFCSARGKTTWRGYSQHVDTVMARIPTAQRGPCDRLATTSAPRARSWLRRRSS